MSSNAKIPVQEKTTVSGGLSKLFRTFIEENYSLTNIACICDSYHLEKIVVYRIEREFPEVKLLENSFSSIKDSVTSGYVYGIDGLLDVEAFHDAIVNFFFDNSVTVKDVKIYRKRNFSTISFQLEYQGLKVSIVQNTFSVERLRFPVTTPYLIRTVINIA